MSSIRDSNKQLYSTWHNMKTRCYNKNYAKWNRYGGRGIAICDEWRKQFKPFMAWALKNGYKENLQIDRIDNDGNYEPGNCRFVTIKENCRNRNKTKLNTNDAILIKQIYNSNRFTREEIANFYGISLATIKDILLGRTWT